MKQNVGGAFFLLARGKFFLFFSAMSRVRVKLFKSCFPCCSLLLSC